MISTAIIISGQQESKIRTWRSGNYEYTETSLYQVERDATIDFEKLPVDASIAMPDEAMDLIEPYDYKALEDFQTKYMSGFFAENIIWMPRSLVRVQRIRRRLMQRPL